MRSINGRQLARHLGEWHRPGASGPAYSRLAAGIRLLILDGRLPLETRLPGERELAAALTVSRTTVTAAYDALRQAGYAASRQGSGTRTTLPPTRAGDTAGSAWAPFGPDDSDLLDLAHASPEAPTHALRSAYDAALEQLPRHLPTCGYNLFGLPDLRAAVAGRFTARGLPTTAEQILITSGAQHAFSLVVSLMLDPGDRVLIEHPTYPNAIDAVRRQGGRPVPVALTENGWDLDAVGAAVRQTAPRLAYLVPDFNNPTGLLATDAERRGLAAHLTRHRTLTVVDETLVDLPLDGTVPPPLAHYLPADLAITIGSVSKTVWGGLRVGWLRADASTTRRLAAARASFDISSAVVEQLTASDLLGELDDIVPVRRAELRERRDALVAALATRLPGWQVRLPAGGLVLWCDMGEPVSSRLVSAAEQYGIRLAAGPRFGVDGAFEKRIRLPYTYPVDVLERAADLLSQAFHGATASPGSSAQRLDMFA